MGLDLAFEEVVTADEIRTALRITEEDLGVLEEKGLPFIEIGVEHGYLTSSILTFFKKMETTQEDDSNGSEIPCSPEDRGVSATRTGKKNR